MKKIFLTLLTLALAFSFSGCSKSSNGTSSSTVSYSKTLYWWRSKEDANNETLQEITKAFKNKTGIEVKVVLKDPRTFDQDVINALASSTNVEEAPDIISFKSQDLPNHILQLETVPAKLFDVLQADGDSSQLTNKTSLQYAKELFVDAAFKSITYNNPKTAQPDLYGLPMAIDTLVLYRNKDVLKKAVQSMGNKNELDHAFTNAELDRRTNLIENAPKTWRDLTELVPLVKITNGDEVSQAAIAMGTSTNVERSYDILQSIMMQNGTQLTSADLDSATFAQSSSGVASSGSLGEKALSFYLQFADPTSTLYTWNDQMPDSVQAFLSGQTAMMIQYSSAYRYLINQSSSLANSIDISPLPQLTDPDSPTGTQNLKVGANMYVETVPSAKKDSDATIDANRKKAAWSFVYFATSRDGSQSYLDSMQMASALKEGSDSGRWSALKDQKSIADVWYKGNDPMAVDKLFIQLIDDAQSGRKSKLDALSSAANQITTILQASKLKWATAEARQAITSGGD